MFAATFPHARAGRTARAAARRFRPERNRAIWVVVLAGCLPHPALAVALRGRVVDADTHQPIAAVEAHVSGAARVEHTDADGVFVCPDVGDGAVDLSLVRVGYAPAKMHLAAAAVAATASTPIEVAMRALAFRQEPIVVSATRAEPRVSPVPQASLTRQDLEDRYVTQDVPVMLSELPSSIYYSENGNGIGYNYLTLRGFDQRRISVLVNGVPQNDPEDQNVYWLDFPDLSANLQDVQVQRGAGTGFYGPPAIGGSVNLVTAAFQPRAGLHAEAGGGTFGTRKFSLELNSGLVNGTYAFYGRYSRLLSDGYRQDAWTNFTSYFFGAARYDEHMTTRVHVYGGPIADGLAYYGVPGSALSDRDARRQNVLGDGSQIENFTQPHYEVLNEWRPSNRVVVANTAFYVQGDGFFDYDGSFADTTYYRWTASHGFHPTRNPGRSLIRAWVGNRQGGWLPRVDLRHSRGDLSVGAELRVHRSEHWGRVRWAEAPPESILAGGVVVAGSADPARKYYSYHGGKDVLGAYAHEVFRASPRLALTGDVHLASNRYRIYDEEFVGTDLTQWYTFVDPRAGLNFNLSSTWNGYASYGYVHREPRLKNLYDAAESSGGAMPQYTPAPGGGFDFDSPLVHPERLHDFELGAGWRRGDHARIDANVYWMDFHDEIVPNGQLDRFGQPVTGNADRSVHRGVELGGQVRPWPVFEAAANVAFSRNEFRDYVVYVPTSDTTNAPVQLGGNEITGFPRFISNVRGTVRTRGVTASLLGRYVSSFFTTNFEDPNLRVAPYFVLDADLAYQHALAKQLVRVHLQVRNVLDRLYVLQGEGDSYFPSATRNAFLSFDVTL